MRRYLSFFLIAGLVVLAQSACAAENTAACGDPNANLPPALIGWGKASMPMATAHNMAEATAHPLAMGQRMAFKLAETTTMTFAHAPSEQMLKQYIYSGMASFRVPKDGNYAVIISEANWIDVIQNGDAIQSLEMRGRIPCAKYGKKIDFPLKSGEAFVQFFGAPYETVDILVAPAP